VPYAFIQEVPADETHYREVRKIIGDDAPSGLVVHLVEKCEHGLRYIDVWESQEAWQQFHDQRVQPAVNEVLARHGISPDPSQAHFEAIDIIDTWFGATHQ